MHKHILLILFLGLLGGTAWVWTHFDETKAESMQQQQIAEISQNNTSTASAIETIEYLVAPGDVFTEAMKAFDISYGDALTIVDAATDVFDFTRIREGKKFMLKTIDGTRSELRYEPDAETMIIVDLSSFTVKKEKIQYDITNEVAVGTIDSSLFLAGAEAGLPDILILELAEVFAWTIDFATEVQTGDSFRVLYEARIRDGAPAGHGDILAAQFVNNGDTYFAYSFEDENGKNQYYDEDGNSLIKQFLKAPLKYNRISSGFSYSRFHPTLQKNTAHRAIDYAAALGTPILSVGDGTVVFASWGGGYGNFIKVRHNGTYQTHYAHLSRFAAGLSVGDRVEQGQIIGYVGSTGFSTGPHLHYEIQKNGTLVNPLTVELPAGDPVSESLRSDFEKKKDVLRTVLTETR